MGLIPSPTEAQKCPYLILIDYLKIKLDVWVNSNKFSFFVLISNLTCSEVMDLRG